MVCRGEKADSIALGSYPAYLSGIPICPNQEAVTKPKPALPTAGVFIQQ